MPPRGQVDQVGVRAQTRQKLPREQTACLRREGQQDHDGVGGREHLLDLVGTVDAVDGRMRLGRALRADHPHAESRGLRGQRQTDGTQAQDPERLTGGDTGQCPPPVPLALTVQEDGQLLDQAEHQGETELRHRLRRHPPVVGDQDPISADPRPAAGRPHRPPCTGSCAACRRAPIGRSAAAGRTGTRPRRCRRRSPRGGLQQTTSRPWEVLLEQRAQELSERNKGVDRRRHVAESCHMDSGPGHSPGWGERHDDGHNASHVRELHRSHAGVLRGPRATRAPTAGRASTTCRSPHSPSRSPSAGLGW